MRLARSQLFDRLHGVHVDPDVVARLKLQHDVVGIIELRAWKDDPAKGAPRRPDLDVAPDADIEPREDLKGVVAISLPVTRHAISASLTCSASRESRMFPRA